MTTTIRAEDLTVGQTAHIKFPKATVTRTVAAIEVDAGIAKVTLSGGVTVFLSAVEDVEVTP